VGDAATPETSYARADDGTYIAYQVLGDADLDLVIVPGFVSNIDLEWQDPVRARLFRRLATFARLIRFDKVGTGLSDRDTGQRPIEQRMNDLRHVLDAVGSERAALFGYSEGGPMSILFAASWPERTAALCLYGTFARSSPAPDYPVADIADRIQGIRQVIETSWGHGETLKWFASELAEQPAAVQRWAAYERAAASPGSASAILDVAAQVDVRPALPAISVPTLVIQRDDDVLIPEDATRYLADQIDGAEWWTQPGEHSINTGDVDALADRMEKFLVGEQRAVRDTDRILSTVLFTDIVDSTVKAAQIGDRVWHEVLDEHDAITRDCVGRHSGRFVKSMGDGAMATFDGPGRAVRCALDLREELRFLDLQVRAGIHTGEVEVRRDDVGGMAVHIGARVAASAGPLQVLVSSTVKDLVVGSGLKFRDCGAHVLKGVPDQWHLYEAVG
jgi:class 3 adenylate cyclase/predicted alpha/beta hydrolase